MIVPEVRPYPKTFPSHLASYCEQINEAIRGNKHHDTRRHLFLNFLREAFKIDPLEVELESKITAGELRGRIDALYRHITLISRIIVTLSLKGAAPKKSDLRGLLDGSYFARQLNLKNLAEPDFFSWALNLACSPPSVCRTPSMLC